MSGNEQNATSDTKIEAISRHLHHLIRLRAALGPFQAAIGSPEGPSGLATLWRPCQEQIDLLLDAAPSAAWAARINLLSQEVRDNLLDELGAPVALADLASALEQACEAALMEVDRALRAFVSAVEQGGTR